MPTYEQSEVIALASEWRHAALGDLESTSRFRGAHRFIKLWIGFNALYSLRSPRERFERQQLERLASWQPFMDSHARHLGRDLYSHAISVLDDPGILNYRTRRRVRIPAPYSPLDTLLAAYQVRCNLFHGHKQPSDSRDQILIQVATNLVSTWLDDLLDYSGDWQA